MVWAKSQEANGGSFRIEPDNEVLLRFIGQDAGHSLSRPIFRQCSAKMGAHVVIGMKV